MLRHTNKKCQVEVHTIHRASETVFFCQDVDRCHRGDMRPQGEGKVPRRKERAWITEAAGAETLEALPRARMVHERNSWGLAEEGECSGECGGSAWARRWGGIVYALQKMSRWPFSIYRERGLGIDPGVLVTKSVDLFYGVLNNLFDSDVGVAPGMHKAPPGVWLVAVALRDQLWVDVWIRSGAGFGPLLSLAWRPPTFRCGRQPGKAPLEALVGI